RRHPHPNQEFGAEDRTVSRSDLRWRPDCSAGPGSDPLGIVSSWTGRYAVFVQQVALECPCGFVYPTAKGNVPNGSRDSPAAPAGSDIQGDSHGIIGEK